jgi:hypothetical protein
MPTPIESDDAKHLSAGSPVKGVPLKSLCEHFPARFGDALNPSRLRSQISSRLAGTLNEFNTTTFTVDTEVHFEALYEAEQLLTSHAGHPLSICESQLCFEGGFHNGHRFPPNE